LACAGRGVAMSLYGLTEARLAVLRELVWLTFEAPSWAAAPQGGFWRPYHVRYFRGQGRSEAARADLTLVQVRYQLGELVKQGYAEKAPGGVVGRAVFRATAAGREAAR
jgi:hypothetical protein